MDMNVRRSIDCCVPVDHDDDLARVDELVAVARAIADPVRMRILDLLRRQGEATCACALLPAFAISQPTLSHHLKRLREAGLVHVERRQQWMYYSVDHDRMEELARWLERRTTQTRT